MVTHSPPPRSPSPDYVPESDHRVRPKRMTMDDPAMLLDFSAIFYSTIIHRSPHGSSPLPYIPSPSLPLSPTLTCVTLAPPPTLFRFHWAIRAVMIPMKAEADLLPISLPYPPTASYSPPISDQCTIIRIPLPLPHISSTIITTLLLPSSSLGGHNRGYLSHQSEEDEIVETLQGAPVSTDTELGRHMIAFETRVRQDTDEIYTRLDDKQSQRQLLAGQLNMLRSMDASDLAREEVMSLRTTILGQMSEIRELHAADHRRQAVTSEMLKADHRRSAEMRELRTTDCTQHQQLIQTLTVMQSLQGQVTTLQGQVTALQGQYVMQTGLAMTTILQERVAEELNALFESELTKDFMMCKPLYFKGTEGVVELTQWFDMMETVLRIRNCSVENQINHDIAYAMTWADLRKKMTDKYCPRNEMKKLEAELWNLKVKGTDVIRYNQRFHELALLCVRMFSEESDKIERYVGGLPDMIHGNIVASKPKTMQEAVEMATKLMDKKVSTIAERQAENKRKFKNTSRNNQNQQQQQNKRQNTNCRAYTSRDW
ncbi:putative reverse transcriptase domain-containing protein [Tanacetum coccineum]